MIQDLLIIKTTLGAVTRSDGRLLKQSTPQTFGDRASTGVPMDGTPTDSARSPTRSVGTHGERQENQPSEHNFRQSPFPTPPSTQRSGMQPGVEELSVPTGTIPNMTSSTPMAREYTETEIMLNFLKALALSELTEDFDPANPDTEGVPTADVTVSREKSAQA